MPDDEKWIAVITGALSELLLAYNWTKDGDMTPDEAVDAFMPYFDMFCFRQGQCRVIGEIIAYAGTTSPDDKWLPCDGSSLLRVDYPDLFTVIGTTYGAVDGTHFNLPDLQGRTPSGAGSGSGLSSVAVGDVYGEENHTLTVSELASHSHNDIGHTHTEITALASVGAAITGVPVPSAVPSVGVTGVGYASLDNAGSDTGHNTIGPRLGITYLIVALQ